MPAENAARQNNLDPKSWTQKNISSMKSQLKRLVYLSIGIEKFLHAQMIIINISKIFLELLEKDLVYRKENYVNWDPVDETVLANEQVIDGKGWRSGATVERKKLSQWFLKHRSFLRNY